MNSIIRKTKVQEKSLRHFFLASGQHVQREEGPGFIISDPQYWNYCSTITTKNKQYVNVLNSVFYNNKKMYRNTAKLVKGKSRNLRVMR